MTTPFRQESFASGVLAQRLRGRGALAKYPNGLAWALNFFVIPEGAALNRPGTPFCTETKDSAANVDKRVRLIPFVFSEDPGQAYVLEFGAGYVRLTAQGSPIVIPGTAPAYSALATYAVGAQVTYGGHLWVATEPMAPGNTYTPGTTYETYEVVLLGGFPIELLVLHVPWVDQGAVGAPYELATPYLEADLPFIKYAQQGDVLTLTCRGHVGRDLNRFGHTNWTLVDHAYDVPVANGAVYISPASVHAADATHLARQWEWMITELWEEPSGLTWETAPLPVSGIAVNSDDPWEATFTYALDQVVSYGGQHWRSVHANNKGNTPEAVMVGEPPEATYPHWEPGAAIPDPVELYTNPMPGTWVIYPDKTVTLWVKGTWTPTSTTGRLAGRRVFRGRSNFFGYVGEFDGDEFLDVGDTPNLAISPPDGRNPFKVFDPAGELVRTESPSVTSYFGERRVMAGTTERPETVFLSRVGDYFNFDKHSPSLLDDAFEFELAGRLREEVRWAVGLEALLIGTQSSVWAVRPPQGTALGPGQSEARIQGASGSSWLDPLVIPPGAVLYVRSKGRGVRDLVYDDGRGAFAGSDLSLLARDLFSSPIVDWAYAEDPWSIVWAVRADGKLLSLTYVRDQEVWAWTLHDTQGLVENVCVIPEGQEDAVYLVVRRQLGDGSWHRYIERMASRETPLDEEGLPDPAAGIFLDSSITATELDYDADLTGVEVTGLDHLEGLEVVALADGAVHRVDPAGAPLVVTAGRVVLPDPDQVGYATVHVGLGYVSELELLPLTVQSRDLRRHLKNVSRVAFELEASRGLEVAERIRDRRGVPTPEADWNVWNDRDLEDGYGVLGLFTGDEELSTFSSWNRAGTAALRQREPLPCTVLAVTREADLGGT